MGKPLYTCCWMACSVALLANNFVAAQVDKKADVLLLDRFASRFRAEEVKKTLDASVSPVAEGSVLTFKRGMPERYIEPAVRYARSRTFQKGSIVNGADAFRYIRDEYVTWVQNPKEAVKPSPEAIIITQAQLRPALLVCNDTIIDPVPPQWHDALEPKAAQIVAALHRVGFISTDQDPPLKSLASCFLVAPKVAITNWHVASNFANADGSFKPTYMIDGQGTIKVTVSFTRYVCNVPQRLEYSVAKVLQVQPDLDFALLLLDDSQGTLPSPLKLAASPPSTFTDRSVYVAGYPLFDTEGATPSDVMQVFFGTSLGVKRVSPGKLMDGSGQSVLYHDCTTLGGNSGSPVLDIDFGDVIGLHASGNYNIRNVAIPAWRLRGNAQLQALLPQ
jgi:hypothetical protein